jgi:H-NS histone family
MTRTTLKLAHNDTGPSLRELIDARDRLTEQIELLQSEQRHEALVFIREQMNHYGITLKQVEESMRKRRGPRRKQV